MGVVLILGAIAGVIMLVVIAYIVALRRYAELLDGTSVPRSSAVTGQVEGGISGRHAALSLSLPRRRPKRPGELRISIEAAAPLTFSAERESLATAFQKGIGLRSDRACGDEALDRRFLFRFDDRPRLRACLAHPGMKRALLRSADLGVGTISVGRDAIAASIPLTLIMPPQVQVVREVLQQLIAAAAAMESPHDQHSGDGRLALDREAADERCAEGAEAAVRPRVVALRGRLSLPCMGAVFLAAVALAYGIAAPMWERGIEASWQEQLSLMQIRLLISTIAAGAVGLLVALLVGGKPIVWGIGLSWPMLFYALAMWSYYLVFRTAGASLADSVLGESEGLVNQVLTVLTAAPALILLSGWAGARLGYSRHPRS